jgi:hypothetical protein
MSQLRSRKLHFQTQTQIQTPRIHHENSAYRKKKEKTLVKAKFQKKNSKRGTKKVLSCPR